MPPLLDIRQQRQISKAREIAIGSDFLAIRRNFDVDSIFACPKSIRTVSKSPVPFKMWRAFVRRKDSCRTSWDRAPPRQPRISADGSFAGPSSDEEARRHGHTNYNL